MKYYVSVYTKEIKGIEYPSALAYSVHMSLRAGDTVTELFQGYGMLFARGVIRTNHTIEEKGLKCPCLLRLADGSWGIAALRVNADHSLDSSAEGEALYWESADLIHFEEKGLISMQQLETLTGVTPAEMFAQAESQGFCEQEIDREQYERLLTAWTPVHAVETCFQEPVCVSSKAELAAVKVPVLYSDGSVHQKQVRWELDKLDFSQPGSYRVTGEVLQPVYPFPQAVGYADPVVFPYEGKWYFIATNEHTDNIGLFAREADTVAELFAPETKEVCILEQNEEKGLVQTFWAPELHVIGGQLYLLFAVSGKVWGPQCHMMKLKEGGSIVKAEDWEEPIRVCRMDGAFLCTEGITLDMTYFSYRGNSYLAWSERYGIGTELDTGSMIRLAKTSLQTPWKLESEPMLLSRPVYGWENQSGTINNEGPYPLQIEDRLYLAYSAASAGGYSYVTGLFALEEQGDVLQPSAWKKPLRPALSPVSVGGECCTGHNSFFRDASGDNWIVYHAKNHPEAMRSTAIRRVHIGKDGTPLLNLSWERDLPEAMKQIEITVQIR